MTDMEFERQLRAIATGMEYPHTPDIAGSVMTRLRTSPSPAGSPNGMLRKGAGGEASTSGNKPAQAC